MTTLNKLDVRKFEPKEKHSRIFNEFDSLSVGEGFMLLNDHDPKPLYYQFQNERPGAFDWQYRQEGPDVWQVEIRKTGGGETEETLGDIVAADFRKSEVFEKFGLDFCCGGQKTLSDACRAAGVSEAEVRRELQKYDEGLKGGGINRFDEWPLDFLTDYILHNHHTYVKKSLAEMPQYVHKVAQAHGDNHPETVEIAGLFIDLAEELNAHLQKEEYVLFPFVKKMSRMTHQPDSKNIAQLSQIQNPVRAMEMEHDAAGNMLAKIRDLSNGFSLPEDACPTYRMVYQFLAEFEADLHQHIHLENNILFPKVLRLADRLTAA